MSDYISREAICLTDFEITMCNGDYKELCKMILDKIANAPAADVRPVRRGKWNIVKLPPDPGYKAKECSSCKCNFWDLEEWNFCPNCGADMRGESDV